LQNFNEYLRGRGIEFLQKHPTSDDNQLAKVKLERLITLVLGITGGDNTTTA
jgi:hypothetical protein